MPCKARWKAASSSVSASRVAVVGLHARGGKVIGGGDTGAVDDLCGGKLYAGLLLGGAFLCFCPIFGTQFCQCGGDSIGGAVVGGAARRGGVLGFARLFEGAAAVWLSMPIWVLKPQAGCHQTIGAR